MAAESSAADAGVPRHDRVEARAREQVVALTRADADVKVDVARTLYGDPSRRHRAYATCGHDRTAEPLGVAPDRSCA